jgi:hypothetical protein
LTIAPGSGAAEARALLPPLVVNTTELRSDETAPVIFRTIVLTAVFTVVALVLSAFRLGPLVVAMLGGFVLWLIPAHLVVALPAAAFGGVLITHAEAVNANEQSEDLGADSRRLIILTTLVSLLTVGWFVPWAGHETGRAFSRYVDRGVEKAAPTPTALTLDELVVQAGSDPAARSELVRRVVWPVAAFLLPLLAIILSRAHHRWRYRSAIGATVAVFVVCLIFWNR